MNSTRIQQLTDFLKETPNDPFLLYALALEFREEKPEEALSIFEKLLEDHPSYIPTYYHAAALYDQLNQRQQALSVYEAGIKKASLAGESLALRELQNAYSMLLFEDE